MIYLIVKMIARLDVRMIHIFALKLNSVEPSVVTVSLGLEAGDESVERTVGPPHVVPPVAVKLVPGGDLAPLAILNNFISISDEERLFLRVLTRNLMAAAAQESLGSLRISPAVRPRLDDVQLDH